MRTRLIAVLVALAAVTVFTTEASAMYHAGMGVFMQRDPGPGAGGPARAGSAGPAVGGGFIHRDPGVEYTAGMNLYEYVKSNPAKYVDPTGENPAVAGAIIAGAALGYTVAHDVVQASDPDVSWTFDALKGTVFVSDAKKNLNNGWKHAECEVKFRAHGAHVLGALLQWEVSWWYHNEGHISQVSLAKTDADDSPCWALHAEIDIVVVPGNRKWGNPPGKIAKVRNPGDFIGREVELKATYSVTRTWRRTVTANSRWRVTGDGAIFRRRFFQRGGSFCSEALVSCNFDAH